MTVSKSYNFHNKKLRNLLVVNFSKQQFKHAESTTRSRTRKKFVRQFVFPFWAKHLITILIKILSLNFLGRFFVVLYPQLLVRTRLPCKPDTVAINSFLCAQFVTVCQSCSRLRLEQLLRFSRALQTSHAIYPIALALALLAIEIICESIDRSHFLWKETRPFSVNSSPITFSSQNSTRRKGHCIHSLMHYAFLA